MKDENGSESGNNKPTTPTPDKQTDSENKQMKLSPPSSPKIEQPATGSGSGLQQQTLALQQLLQLQQQHSSLLNSLNNKKQDEPKDNAADTTKPPTDTVGGLSSRML